MADEKKPVKTVEVELLADGIRLDEVDYVRGDVVTLPEDHAERLRAHGSVGPKGTVEKQLKAQADREEAEARYQAALAGHGEFGEPADLGRDADKVPDGESGSESPKPGPRAAQPNRR